MAKNKAEEIINRMGSVLNISDQREIRKKIAEDIGVERQNVDRWITRNSIPMSTIYDFSLRHEVSIYWLTENLGDRNLFIIDRELLVDILTIAEEFVEKTGIDWDKATMVKNAFLIYEQELKSHDTSKESQTKMLELLSKVS